MDDCDSATEEVDDWKKKSGIFFFIILSELELRPNSQKCAYK